MSKMKYDDEVCSKLVLSIDAVAESLATASEKLKVFVNSLPTKDNLVEAAKDLSYIRVEDDNGNFVRNADGEYEYKYSSRKYNNYQNSYINPCETAKNALLTISDHIAGFSQNASEMKDKLDKVRTLIYDFESNTRASDVVIEFEAYGSGSGGSAGGRVSTTYPSGSGGLNDSSGLGVTAGVISTLNIDTDGDGKPDLNIDTDGDGKPNLNIDIDGDGAPDLNIDTDGDGKADLNVDTDGDGKPNLNIDLDGDGKADLNIDIDNDGKPDLNIDVDGDGAADLNIDTNNDGKPDVNIDADGDGVVDPKPDEGANAKPPKVDEEPEDSTKPEAKPSAPPETSPKEDDSSIFNKDEAGRTSGGFADNITAGGAGMIGAGAIAAAGSGSGEKASTKATTAEEEAEALFAFLPGGASEESSDFMYRGLFDQSGSGDVGSIKYQSLDGGGVGVAKGAAAVAAAGLGVSGVDAFATLNEQRKQECDVTSTEDEKNEKTTIKTIISSGILGILSIAFMISVLNPNASVIAIILLGIAMAISAIASSTGLKIGKYIGFGLLLVSSLLTFILGAAGIISPVGYIVIFGSFVVLSVAAILLDLLKGMFNDKIDLVSLLVAISVGLLVAMFKVLNVISWIIFVVLMVLTIGGYFLYEKVIKNKLPDGEEDVAQTITYNQVQTQPIVQENVVQAEGQYDVQPVAQVDTQMGVQLNEQPVYQVDIQAGVQPSLQPSVPVDSQNFDPRSLYDQSGNAHPSITDRINTEPQNPFAGYNPMNSSFSNAFKDDGNNNNNSGTFDGFI